jgi:hypothetical protein
MPLHLQLSDPPILTTFIVLREHDPTADRRWIEPFREELSKPCHWFRGCARNRRGDVCRRACERTEMAGPRDHSGGRTITEDAIRVFRQVSTGAISPCHCCVLRLSRCSFSGSLESSQSVLRRRIALQITRERRPHPSCCGMAVCRARSVQRHVYDQSSVHRGVREPHRDAPSPSRTSAVPAPSSAAIRHLGKCLENGGLRPLPDPFCILRAYRCRGCTSGRNPSSAPFRCRRTGRQSGRRSPCR